jgi:hypothetical protein
MIAGQVPVTDEFIGLRQADGQRRVYDINSEEHGGTVLGARVNWWMDLNAD